MSSENYLGGEIK